MAAHDAFISYSRRDRVLARMLERRLEKYRPPKGLNLPRRHLEVFRDESDFTGPEYRSALKEHLAGSHALIVLCSPAACASEYVNEEIREFAAAKGVNRIVPVLVGGIPNNEATPERENEKAFPRALCDLLEMPLAANYLGFDPRKNRVDRGAYFDAWSTVLANLFGVSRSELEQRERKRRARSVTIAIAATAAIVAMLVIALIVTLISRSEAVEQAIAARRETATRLAIQAVEKLDGSPEQGLTLALEAVETYWRHGDPPVPRALEALHKARLSFGGGRPLLPWREDQETLTYSPDLSWVATSAADGTTRFARAGSDDVRVLAPPSDALPAGKHWGGEYPSRLLFAGERLFGARCFEGEEYGCSDAAIWFWPLAKTGITEPPRVVATISGDFDHIELRASADGRWLSWGDSRGVVLQAVGSAEPPLALETNQWIPDVWSFSPDLSEFIVSVRDGVQRVHLDTAAGKAEPTELLPVDLREVVAFAIAEPAPREHAEGPRRGLGRIALLAVDGRAEWWDLENTPSTRHELPDLFTAYAGDMQIVRVDRADVHAELSWSPWAPALLASFVHDSREFGIAAWIDASTTGAAWNPLIAQQLQSQTVARTDRVSGDAMGATAGYRLLDQKNLGAAAASWYGPAVITLGFDGTLMFRDIEDGRESVFGTRAAVVAPLAFDRRVIAGGQDGKLRAYDGDNEDDTLQLNGHDAAVREIARTENRIVTVDTAGTGRIWTLDNPVLDPDGFEWVTPDWRWAIHESGGVLDLRAADPFMQPAAVAPPPTPICPADGCDSFATFEASGEDPAQVKVRLWSLHDGDIPSAPDVERDYVFTDLGERWFWHTQQLALSAESARFLMTGSGSDGRGAWIVDLRDERASPVKLFSGSDEFEIESTSDDLSRLLVGKGDGVRDKEHTELRVLDLAAPGGEPVLVLPKERYGTLSPDGRWLALGKRLYDLDGDRSKPRLESEDEYTSLNMILAAKRPPLYLDDEANLWGVDATPGSQAPARQVLAGMNLTEVAWDRTGSWLGLGNRAGRAWIVVPAREGLEALADALAGVTDSTALPPAWDPAASNEIEALQLLAREGMALAETDNDHVLLWRRDPRRGWSEPLLFQTRDLYEGYSDFQCRPDRSLCIVGGQILSFDEPQLLAMSKALLSGRVTHDAAR